MALQVLATPWASTVTVMMIDGSGGVHSKAYANQNIYSTSEFLIQVQSYERGITVGGVGKDSVPD